MHLTARPQFATQSLILIAEHCHSPILNSVSKSNRLSLLPNSFESPPTLESIIAATNFNSKSLCFSCQTVRVVQKTTPSSLGSEVLELSSSSVNETESGMRREFSYSDNCGTVSWWAPSYWLKQSGEKVMERVRKSRWGMIWLWVAEERETALTPEREREREMELHNTFFFFLSFYTRKV